MNMEFEPLSNQVIQCAITVHRELGPGLLESTYEACLSHELNQMGIQHLRQRELPVRYKGMLVDCGYRVDLLIEDQLIVELKAVEKLLPIHTAQLLTYLRLAKIEIGLLMNFNVSLLKDGLKRILLN